MAVSDFIEDPFGKKSVHPAYGESVLHMRPAPEMATGEVVLASLQRNLGFNHTTERTVPANGRHLLQRVTKGKRTSAGIGIALNTWQNVLDSSLRSPKQPNQSKKRFLQLCPIVPDCTLYSSAARLTTNSWNPGNLVERMISFGCPTADAGAGVWERLFAALSVTELDDDPWALALQREFSSWRIDDEEWVLQPFEHLQIADAWRVGGGSSPAQRFVADLEQVLILKTALTRRQWVSLVECLLRLATSAQILWLSKANRECLKILRDALRGDQVPSELDLANERLAVGKDGYWRYGQKAADTIRDYAREFVMARAGLNLLFFIMDEIGGELAAALHANPLSSPSSIHSLALLLRQNRDNVALAQFETSMHQVMDREPRLIAAKKGIGSNVVEFLRHCLGQRQTSEDDMKSYDQGYWLRKSGYYASAPWIISAGPVAVLLLAYCCSRRKVGPTTVDDLCSHLNEYGISVRPLEIQGGDLGSTLRSMGLVTDSPDAEGGMLIRNPFDLDRGCEQ